LRKKPRAPKRAQSRLAFIEGLRGVCALYVVLGHLCSMSDPSKLAGRKSTAPVWFQNWIYPFSFGHLAVASFIVISGFCLQLSLFSQSGGKGDGRINSIPIFFWRRAKRILPPYYGCLAISTWVAINITTHIPGMPFEMYLPANSATIWAHVLLVHNWSLEWMYKINGVLWSIAIEAQLYVLFPFIVASIGKFGRLLTLAMAGMAAWCTLQDDPGALKLYTWYLPLFVTGMVSAHLAYKPNFLVRSTLLPRLAGVGSFAATCYAVKNNWSLPATDLCVGTWVACVCHVGTVGKPSPVVRLFSLWPLVALGTFSYSLYLMHHPIQQLLFWYRPRWVVDEVTTMKYLLERLPVILLGSWVFSLVFERPFMNRSKKKKPAPRGSKTVVAPLVTASEMAFAEEPSHAGAAVSSP
jgi:peptidoglycan/LPS O-acetylase OafA/YrhL